VSTLIESKTLRDEYAGKIAVLEKVKALILLPDGMHATVEMTASYYEVGKEAINSVIKDRRDELEEDGLRVLRGDGLMSFKDMGVISKNTSSFTNYFYTIKMIESTGWDEPINNAFDFLWDYQNHETRMFLLRVIQSGDDLRKAQGQVSVTEEWAQENDIRTFRAYTDETGKQFVVDSNGQLAPIRRAKPKHLKLVH
jgi:hypothetical protein